MKKSCSYCGRTHERGEVCPKKPIKKMKYSSSTEERKFRSSYIWQCKRNEIVSRDMYLCRACLEQGRIERAGIQVHHITPLADDYTRRLDNSNLISLCVYHHERAESGGISAEHLRELALSPPVLPSNPMRSE